MLRALTRSGESGVRRDPMRDLKTSNRRSRICRLASIYLVTRTAKIGPSKVAITTAIPSVASTRISLRQSTAPARRPARIALQASPISHEGEVAAFAAAVAFVAFHAGFVDLRGARGGGVL